MKNFTQLVRWGMPGFTWLAFAIALAAVADSTVLTTLRKKVFGDGDAAPTLDVLAGVVGVIAFVTAAGYVLAIVHHFLLTSVYPPFFCPDLRPAIKKAGIKLEDFSNKTVDSSELTTAGAWIAVSVVWHSNRGEEFNRVTGAEWRSSSMFDIMHGAGATFIGTVLSLPSSWLIGPLSVAATAIWIALVIAMGLNYHGTVRRAEAVTGGLLVAVSIDLKSRTISLDRNLVTAKAHRSK